ncbi:ABC transporter substrate-binding protein [Undibacter mobilis]|uniref:ABC transporter substrate-binding protein n=1 Tax=Undibacter mobilis TaxID=2292256 RepID=A0A371B9Z4_9BRAD|nr:ABC transporter substrate-binding protein [Undibacter mobilis]RDV04374.1 ABC transporter substrate-binding protein [Undibacter mobilis]
MKTMLYASAATIAVALMAPAHAQDTVKIGVILPYSGQFADGAKQMDAGIKLYMKMNGDTVAGKKIEIIRKDVAGPQPPVAKRLAQELIVRDNVDILAGFLLTPNAMAASDVSAEAKKFMVIMNAATSIITTKSNYSVRTSHTLPQVSATMGTWAAKNGVKKSYTMVSDYGPGHDAETSFQAALKAAGGETVGSVRMAVANPDFSAYVQRAKDLGPESIFVFIPGGAQPAAIGKAFAERGIDSSKTKILGTGELTDDSALANMGDTALGVITAWTYDHNHKSALNEKFVAEYRKDNNGENPNFFVAGGYDGMHVIYEALKKTGGKTDGEALVNAAKGLKWEAPRGPMMIDPETRDIVQTIYIRKVEKVGGKLVNVEFDKVENVKDPVKAAMK